jgi:hypothetical protein
MNKIIIVVIFVIMFWYFNPSIEGMSNSLRNNTRVSDRRINKDCEMTKWSNCDAFGKQHREITSNSTGFGKKCEPLVQNCTVPATVNTWEACQTSNQCNGSDLFCRVGDNRCLRDGECSWANYTDHTNRDCTRIVRF